MAYDFPNAPTVGQAYNNFLWDGEKWIQTLAAPNSAGVIAIKVFTASGTYIPSVAMTTCVIEAVGGGGGSGGVTGAVNNSITSGSGASGGYSRTLATAAMIGASQVVTIGAGGAGAPSGSSNGGNGGTTSVGTMCVANGGGGGGYATPSGAGTAASGYGGIGAPAGVGDVTIKGTAGTPGTILISTSSLTCGPTGGNSFFGGAGGTGVNVAGGAGSTGSGAGGSNIYNFASGYVGGPGGAGLVVITEYGITLMGASTGSSLLGAVRYDIAQGLSAPQQVQARDNTGAVARIGDTMTGDLQINAELAWIGAAWTPYTPSTSWTGGGAGNATGRYKRLGKTCAVSFAVTCTTAGNMSMIGLPVQAGPASYILTGRENALTGNMWQGFVSAGSSTVLVLTYANQQAVAVGASLLMSGIYETV